MAFNNKALASNKAARATGAEASDQDSNNVVARSVNEWINQQQRNASLVARTNEALDGSLPYTPFLIDLPSASRASEQNLFDEDFGQYNTQSDADTEVQTNAERVDDFQSANIQPEQEQDGNWEADLFDEDMPHAAETSSELVEDQTVAVVDEIRSSEPILVSEDEMHRSPQLPQNSDVEVPGSRPAQDLIAIDSQEAIDSTTQLLQSRVPGAGAGAGAGAGPQQVPNVAEAQIVLSVSAANLPGNQIPRAIAPNAPSTSGVQQPPATTNTGTRRGKYIPKIQTRPPRTRGPLQQRPVPVWPEFLLVTPAVRANAAGHETALRMITHARNVPSLKTVGNTDLITSSSRTGGTPGDWKPVVIANFLNEWIRRTYNGLELWKKEGKSFREQINWYDRRPLMEQADIRIFITEQVEALLPAADQQRIAQLRQNYQPPGSQLTTQVADGTWQPPIFGPPSAAFLALVAAHDAAQANSGAQLNQMGSGLGGGPVSGIGGGPNSSQPLAGFVGYGANSSAAGGIQAPHPAQSANPHNSLKRDRDDAGSDNDENDSDSQELPAPPPSKKLRQGGHSDGMVSQNMMEAQMLSSSNMLAWPTTPGDHLRSTEFGGAPMGNPEHQLRGSTQAQGGSRAGHWSPTSRSLGESANTMYGSMTEGIGRQAETPIFESVHESLEDLAEGTSRSSFGAGMHEQPSHLADYGAPYSVVPYPTYGAPAHGPYGQQLYSPQQTPYDQSAHQTYDAPQGSFEQQQYLPPQPLYDQPAHQQYGSTAPDPWMQSSNPARFDFENIDPALFELPGLSSGPSLPTEDNSREVSEDIDTRTESRRANPRFIEDEEYADRVEAYWRNEESRARGGLAARPEVFGFGVHGPGRHQGDPLIRGNKRGVSDDGDEEGGDGYYSVQEKSRGKRHREL